MPARHRRTNHRARWALALGLAVLILVAVASLGRSLWRGTGPLAVAPLPWARVSDADRAAATRALTAFYSGLKAGDFAAASQAVTPVSTPGSVPDAVVWMTDRLVTARGGPVAALKTCSDQVQALGWAVEQWSADHDVAELPSNLDALVPVYYKTLPRCPSGAPYHYEHSSRTGQFTVQCQGRNHRLAGEQDNSPEYSSVFGLGRRRLSPETSHPTLISFAIQDVAAGDTGLVAHVREEVQFLGETRTALSTVGLQQVGDAWRVVMLAADNGRSVPAGGGLGEAYLWALAVSPDELRKASARPENLTVCGYNLQRVGAALEAYASDHRGTYPPHLADLLPAYLRDMPRCPVDDGAYAEGYVCRGQDYTLTCPGGRHAGCNVPPGYPRIDDLTGLKLSPQNAASGRTPGLSLHE